MKYRGEVYAERDRRMVTLPYLREQDKEPSAGRYGIGSLSIVLSEV